VPKTGRPRKQGGLTVTLSHVPRGKHAFGACESTPIYYVLKSPENTAPN
jgi:hypothetical protein